ncbi:MAG TPA: ATP-grasp domain-containing protein [Candidatus Saccharimonadales bacterium]
MNILVLQGGTGNGRDYSLHSGTVVVRTLHALGHTTTIYDPADGLEGMDRLLPHIDLVFPALHDAIGEDGTVQAFLDSYKVRYVGAGVEASKLCFDKIASKQAFEANGIKTPKWQEVTAGSFITSPLAQHPYTLKPRFGGSNISTIVAHTGSATTIDMSVFDRYDTMLLEELVDGIALNVVIIGNEALPVVEIVPPESEKNGNKNTYTDQTKLLSPPTHIDITMQEQAQAIGELIHAMIGVRHLSQINMVLSRHGEVYALEINTLPSFAETSSLPKAAAAAGISMEQLFEQLINLALAD